MRSIERQTNILVAGILLALVANPLSHYLQNRWGLGNPYYASYVVWTILLIITTFNLKYTTSVKFLILDCIMLLMLVMGSLNGNYQYETLSNLHTGIFIFIAFLITLCRSYNVRMTDKHIALICNVMVGLGIIASIYALAYQLPTYLLSLSGIDMHLNGWGVISFFSQRNIFASYCVLCSIASCYMYLKTRKVVYLAVLLLLGCNILVTNSRASLVYYVISICPPLYLCSRYQKWFIAVALLALVIVIFYGFDTSYFDQMFDHSQGGQDSSEKRVLMWEAAFYHLFRDFSWLVGFGIGTISDVAMKVDGVGSSHNFYVDMFFSGGIVFLLIYLYSMYYALRLSLKNNDNIMRILFSWSIFGYAVYCMLEAGSGLFASNYFSVTTTILFILIPKNYGQWNYNRPTN